MKFDMNKRLLPALVIYAFCAASLLADEPLANEDKSGLYAKSIEHVLRMDPEEVDLATAVLIISEQWNENVYGRRYIERLDDMAREIRDILKDKRLSTGYKAVAVINEYLFEKQGFEPVAQAANPDDLFLHTVLDKKRGYCLSLSVLYLGLAERLGLPLYGVVVPGHFFVRYDDGNVRFNIETTAKGGYTDDRHYIDKFNILETEEGGIYLTNLNKLQTLGCFFNNLGNSYSNIEDIEQAQLALERAVQINPSLAEAHINLGNIYLQADLLEDALYQYKAAMRINPNDAKTHNGLGNAYSRKGWYGDAISQFERAIRLDPNLTDAYRNLASAYCNEQMFASAISSLKDAVALEPQDANCICQLGDVYCRQGSFDTAVLQYKKALRLNKNLAQAHYGLALCYNRLGQSDEEIGEYKSALAIEPDMVPALVNLGNAYFERQRYSEAIEYYQKAAVIKPDNSSVHYNLGAAYSNGGFYEKAEMAYQQAIRTDPELVETYGGLAFVYYKLKNYELAAENMKKAQQAGVEVSQELNVLIESRLK